MATVPAAKYYETYHGHEVRYLEKVVEGLRKQRPERLIWLAGDSSLDNKYWVKGTLYSPVNGYASILDGNMVADVNYWLNWTLVEQGRGLQGKGTSSEPRGMAAVNTSVEATTLGERVNGGKGWFTTGVLREQDQFIAREIREEDYLIVSVGGNDIALAPTWRTVVSMLWLARVAPTWAIRSGWDAALCGHFLPLFRDKLTDYISQLVAKRKPKKVLVCMIYYPDISGRGWADTALNALSYKPEPEGHPERLQAAISAVFEYAVSKIRIAGTEVVPVPLFKCLDGKNTEDYVARVEPSELGGQKMAKFLLEHLAEGPGRPQ